MDIVKEKKFKSDCRLVEEIRRGSKDALEELFFEYYQDLCAFAFSMIRSNEQAKDIVQDVFYKLWKGRKEWNINVSLKAYLFQAVRNHTLNYIRKNSRYQKFRKSFAEETKARNDIYNEFEPYNRRLLKKIWTAVNKMPEKRKMVFILHQKQGLKYKEIADVLNIAPKTVENHMGLALKEIREYLNGKLSKAGSSVSADKL